MFTTLPAIFTEVASVEDRFESSSLANLRGLDSFTNFANDARAFGIGTWTPSSLIFGKVQSFSMKPTSLRHRPVAFDFD